MSNFERFCQKDQESRIYLEREVKIKSSVEDMEQATGVDLRPILERFLDLDQTTSLKIYVKHIFNKFYFNI